MKIIIFAMLIGLAFTSQLSKNICLDSIQQELDPICYSYEFDCQTCYTKKYIDECLTLVSEDVQCGQCADKCKNEWCWKEYERCNECYKKYRYCTCPEGTSLKIYENGVRQCELLDCPAKYWRPYESKCTDCQKCDPKCKICDGSATNCDKCEDEFCHVEHLNECATAADFTCPSGLLKHQPAGQKCPSCIEKCPEGYYQENGLCIKCPAQCVACKNAETCTNCVEPFCLYDGKCLNKEDALCPLGLFKTDNTDDKCFSCVECKKCPPNTWCDPETRTCNYVCPKPSFIYQKDCIRYCPGGKTTFTHSQFPESITLDQSFNSLNGWSYNGNKKFKATFCGTDIIIGGYKQFGNAEPFEKSVSKIPAHDTLNIIFKLYFIDSWDWSEQWGFDQFEIYVDDNLVKTIKRNREVATVDLCGQTRYTDLIEDVKVSLSHTNSQAKITFKTNSNQGTTDESWGIRDLKLQYVHTEPVQFLIEDEDENRCVACGSCPEGTYCDREEFTCALCDEIDHFIYKTDCIDTCPTPLYRYEDDCILKCPDGTFANKKTRKCEECSDNCKLCFGSADTCIFPCESGFILDESTNTCVKACQPTQYVSKQDGTVNNYYCNPKESDCVCKACNDKCVTCIGPADNDCITCPPGKYLSNGKCVLNCPVGHYADDHEMACNCCDESCAECNGPAINECTKCTGTDIFFEGSCYESSAASLVQLSMQQKNKKH